VDSVPETEKGQACGFLFGGLSAAAFRFHSNLAMGAADRDRDSERRVMRGPALLDESIARKLLLACEGRHLQGGLRIHDGVSRRLSALADDPRRKLADRVKPPVFHDGSQDGFQELGQDAVARPEGGQTRGGEAQPFGQAGEPAAAGPGRASPSQIARRALGMGPENGEGQRKVPGGVAEESSRWRAAAVSG